MGLTFISFHFFLIQINGWSYSEILLLIKEITLEETDVQFLCRQRLVSSLPYRTKKEEARERQRVSQPYQYLPKEKWKLCP